jgi:hypothetical protein
MDFDVYSGKEQTGTLIPVLSLMNWKKELNPFLVYLLRSSE